RPARTPAPPPPPPTALREIAGDPLPGAPLRVRVGSRPAPRSFISQLFDDDLVVRVDADLGGGSHRFLGDPLRVQVRVARESAGDGEGEVAAGADGADPVLRLDDVAGAGDDEGGFAVGDDEEGLEAAEQAVGAPVLGELDRGAAEVAVHLAELVLEALVERERIGASAGEARKHAVVVETPDLPRVPLHDRLPDGHLSVAGHDDAAAVTDADDRRTADLRHGDAPCRTPP